MENRVTEEPQRISLRPFLFSFLFNRSTLISFQGKSEGVANGIA